MFRIDEYEQALRMGDLVISLQKDYIKELKQKVDELEKALDAAKQNKVKVRKVRPSEIHRNEMRRMRQKVYR